MQLKLIARDEIDIDRWDTVILSSRFFRTYGLSRYLDIVAPEWRAVIVGDYRLVMPLPIVSKGGFRRVVQPILCQQLGIFGKQAPTATEVEQILEVLKSEFYQFNIKVNPGMPLPEYLVAERLSNVELILNNTQEAARSKYNRNAKSNIKKAEKQGLDIGRSDAEFEAICDLFRKSKADVIGKNSHIIDEMKSLFQAFHSQGTAEAYFAKKDGKLIAGVLLITAGNRLLNLLTATSDKARGTGASHAIFDAIISSYSESEWVLDFEGSSDPNLKFFYQSFGGAETVYLRAKFSRIPLFVRRLYR